MKYDKILDELASAFFLTIIIFVIALIVFTATLNNVARIVMIIDFFIGVIIYIIGHYLDKKSNNQEDLWQ